ncbi:hypothetical protein V6N12_032198 [Hibiscus sabdariffa]|uniref:Uncharacterized protein ycf68 n=1 Tax=Hibiscus sabdariffa TaxID=183260 RepID=A0ABR2CDW7_9ROSI
MGESLTEQCRVERMQALSGMIGRKASVGGFLSPPSNPRAQPWTGGGNYQAGVRLPVISRRKVRMTSSHHAPYALGDTRATMDGTKGRDPARRAPSGRPARRAISSVVERAPDNCVVVPGLRIDGAIQVRSNVDPTFYSLVGSGRSGGDHHGSSLLDNPYIPYQYQELRDRPFHSGVTEGSYHSSLFFHAFPGGPEKAAINRIFLILPSRKEEREILYPFRRDQEIGSSGGVNKHTWRAQYNGELYAAFGKDESLLKRNLLILSQLVGP